MILSAGYSWWQQYRYHASSILYGGLFGNIVIISNNVPKQGRRIR